MTKDKIIDEEIRQAIKELSNLLDEFDLTEVQVENNKIGKIKVAKNSFNPQSSNIASNQNINDADSGIEKPKIQNDENIIKSPMVGTIYLQPEPESDPFIKIGDKVNKGQTLLIVEAMKTMNNIVADKDGVLKEILVGNEQPVQYDDPLIILE